MCVGRRMCRAMRLLFPWHLVVCFISRPTHYRILEHRIGIDALSLRRVRKGHEYEQRSVGSVCKTVEMAQRAMRTRGASTSRVDAEQAMVVDG